MIVRAQISAFYSAITHCSARRIYGPTIFVRFFFLPKIWPTLNFCPKLALMSPPLPYTNPLHSKIKILKKGWAHRKTDCLGLKQIAVKVMIRKFANISRQGYRYHSNKLSRKIKTTFGQGNKILPYELWGVALFRLVVKQDSWSAAYAFI
jgi:hypothetical protein